MDIVLTPPIVGREQLHSESKEPTSKDLPVLRPVHISPRYGEAGRATTDDGSTVDPRCRVPPAYAVPALDVWSGRTDER